MNKKSVNPPALRADAGTPKAVAALPNRSKLDACVNYERATEGYLKQRSQILALVGDVSVASRTW
jgi:hypothetical protein